MSSTPRANREAKGRPGGRFKTKVLYSPKKIQCSLMPPYQEGECRACASYDRFLQRVINGWHAYTMSGFPIIDRVIFEESGRLAAFLYLAVTGFLCKYPPKDGKTIFADLDTRSAESMRALLLDLARPYRNPGARANPEFLKRLIGARDFPLPPGNALLSFPLRVFDLLRDLRAHLCDTHQPTYWYRGQNTQHVAVYEDRVDALATFDPDAPNRNPILLYSDRNWVALMILRHLISKSNPGAFVCPTDGLVALDPPGEVRLAFDSPIASFYRSAATTIPAHWTELPNHDLPPLDYVSRAARAIMGAPRGHPIKKLLLKFLEDAWRPAMLAAVRREGGLHVRDPEAEARALPYTNVQQSELDLISLAQHYEYGSVMVDITRSIDVALWFAAFRWKDDSLIGSSSEEFGVVYRFDAEAIKPMIRTNFGHSEENRLLVPHLGLFGMADISAMDAQIAMRPRAQQGGSLLGFENSVLHLLLADGRHVQAFAFPHRSADGSETPFRKPDLCPADDPALAVFHPNETSKEPITPDELDRFLRESSADDRLREQIVRQRTLKAI